MRAFRDFFRSATGHPCESLLLDVPVGLGKIAAITSPQRKQEDSHA